MSNYGDSKLTYGQYLKVPELTSLQHCLSVPPSHDELQFIIVHQTYELWFKLMLFELDSIVQCFQERNVRYAAWLFRRVNSIAKVLYQQIHVLETMSPVDFLRFRGHLNPASGFQSVQFREIEFLCRLKDPALLNHLKSDPESLANLKRRLEQPTLWDAFLDLLRKEGFDIPDDGNGAQVTRELLKIHQNEQHHDLFLLTEEMIEFDELIGLWRLHHIRMVERMIGNKIGTGGSEGVKYLETTLQKKFFPEIWNLRTLL